MSSATSNLLDGGCDRVCVIEGANVEGLVPIHRLLRCVLFSPGVLKIRHLFVDIRFG